MITRLCVTALAVTAQVACASAPRTRSFAELPKFLKTGNTIHLTDSAGTTSIGQLGTMSPTTLRLWVGGDLLVGIGLGTAVGAIVGARVKVQRTVYEAPVTPPSAPPIDLRWVRAR